ncbi:MAG TPA: hypothetical protein VLA37_03950 [Sphingomonadaceae bacterium]|nr:hypothetical protein [Sphingomonadaceae bacterium]
MKPKLWEWGKEMRGILFGMAFATLGLSATPAWADVAGRYETIDENSFFKMEMTVEADSAGNVRVQMARQASCYLLLDGELYVIGRDTSGIIVTRLEDAVAAVTEAAQQMGFDDSFLQDEPEPSVPTFVAMGEETVGDRKGTAYGMAGADGSEPLRADFVISNDPRLAPLGKALADLQKSMKPSTSAFGRVSIALGRMTDEMVAVLEQGAPIKMTQLELTDFSLDAIDPERFRLPAEPLTLEQLRAQQEPFPPPPTLPIKEE